MTLTAVDAGFRPTTPRRDGLGVASAQTYRELLRTVREAGLMDRTRGYYIGILIVLGFATVGAATGFVLLGHSWYQLLVAGFLGVVLTQFAFVAHEASHGQVFASPTANTRVGRLLANGVVGISYTWWMNKHSRHHANPNMVAKDPDISPGVLRFTEDDAATTKSRAKALFTRNQGWLFFPLITLEGLNLHVTSLRSLLGGGLTWPRVREALVIFTRLAIYVGVVFWLLSPGLAFAFLGVQLAVFGFYMGASFAPNHKGMKILPADSRVDFFTKQVVTSRNIRGGAVMNHAMGGLNYQIEHHLFPTMARPHLARARVIVKDYCEKLEVPYTETGLFESYGIVVRYLNEVGLAARDPFDCPARFSMR
ncbi:MAG: acyl-CoA desaturase [Actinomycetales bacterium]|nr:acyl-CoA desaturase [Actinomycetales bacterium]